MSALGFGGGSIGGADTALIRARLVIDTSAVKGDMDKGKDDAEKGGKSTGKRIAEGLDVAAKAAYLLKMAFQVAKKVVSEVTESVKRLSELRGVGDPVTGSFLRLEASITKAWDSLVLGVLKSEFVQKALAAVSDSLQEAAKWATGLGGRIDAFAKEHKVGIQVFAAAASAWFAGLKGTLKELGIAFKFVGSLIEIAAGSVIANLGMMVKGMSSILSAVGFTEYGDALDDVGEKINKWGADLEKSGLANAKDSVVDAFTNVKDSILDVADAATSAYNKVGAVIDNVEVHDTTSTSLRDPMQELRFLRDTFGNVAGEIGEAWQAGLGRMSDAMKAWAADARKIENDAAASVIDGGERVVAAFTAFGSQAEQAFGKSSRAAAIYAKAQLAIQALVAGVSGTIELGEASKESTKNPAAVASHLGAAALFFAAAGLAGAQFAGLVGGKGGGSRAAPLETSASVSSDVAKNPPVLILNIQGNVLGSEEYIKNSLIPRMRNLVEEQGVTFAASDLVGNGRV